MFYEIEHICFPFPSTRESIFIQFVMKRGICIYCHLLSRKLIYCDDFQQKNGMFRVKRNRLEELLTEHINIFYLRRVKSTYFPSKRPNMIFFSFFLFVAKRFDRIHISRCNVKTYYYSWKWKKRFFFLLYSTYMYWIVEIDHFSWNEGTR